MRQNEEDRLRRLSLLNNNPQVNHWLRDDSNSLKRILIARYGIASEVVSGSVVDAACGYGYGMSMLLQNSRVEKITGIELDKTVIAYASEKMKEHRNARFICSDLETCEVPACDWVVTLETVEHLREPVRFVDKLKQICSGIVISVPILYTPNPHHVWTHFEPEEIDGWFDGWNKTKDERIQDIMGGKLVDLYKVGAYVKT